MTAMSETWCSVKMEADMHDMPLQHLEQVLCCCSNSRNPHAECPVKPLARGLPLLQDREICPSTPRANDGASEAGSSCEQEQLVDAGEEKARLYATVAAFVKKAVVGFEVQVMHPETATVAQAYFLMDSRLTTFSLRAKHEMTAAQVQQDYNITDIQSVYRRPDVAGQAPAIAGCVGMNISSVWKHVFFLFDNVVEQDEFFTSMKILRLSMQVDKAK